MKKAEIGFEKNEFGGYTICMYEEDGSGIQASGSTKEDAIKGFTPYLMSVLESLDEEE